jgi:hypothetical protein
MYLSRNGNTLLRLIAIVSAYGAGLRLATGGGSSKARIITHTEAEMQGRESHSDVNPGNVERELDDAPVEREGLRGGPVTEREREDGGQITQREVFESRGQVGREDAMNSSRSGGMENRPGDRSDPMPPAGGSSR